MQSVFHAGFLFLHLRFRGCADFDDGYAADQFCQPLLKLLPVIIGGGFFDLVSDLLHSCLDVGCFTFAVNDNGVFFVNGDSLGLA